MALGMRDGVKIKDEAIITWQLFVYMNIFFLEPENTHGTKSLFPNGYFKTFLLAFWSASDLSSAKAGPTLQHSIYPTSRHSPRNLALCSDFYLQGVQIIVESIQLVYIILNIPTFFVLIL